MAAKSDHDDSEDECEFPGFCRLAHTAGNINKEEEEEDGPLYNMEALMSELDTMMSSPSKVSNNFQPSEDKDNLEDDLEETPTTRKITVRAKGKEMKVTGKGRQVKTDKDPKEMTVEKKTKGALL